MTVLEDQIFEAMRAAGADGLRLPPPVFEELKGQFIAYDAEEQTLVVRFPVEDRFLNPAGILHGGITTAAIDCTTGPLSYLVAPPSMTSHLETTYLRPVRSTDAYLEVEARVVEQAGRQLILQARARNPEGETVALARATHVLIRPK